jgi:hypothetical protein
MNIFCRGLNQLPAWSTHSYLRNSQIEDHSLGCHSSYIWGNYMGPAIGRELGSKIFCHDEKHIVPRIDSRWEQRDKAEDEEEQHPEVTRRGGASHSTNPARCGQRQPDYRGYGTQRLVS